MARQIVLAVVFATCFPAGADVATGDDELPSADELGRAVDAFRQALHGANGMQMQSAALGRRLTQGSIPSISYAQVCQSACWTNLETQSQIALQTMDSPECKAKEKVDKAKKVVAAKKQVAEKKKKKKEDADKKKKGGRLLGGHGGSGGGGKKGHGRKEMTKEESTCIFDMCAKPLMQQMCANVSGIQDNFKADSCAAANAAFLCNSVCSTQCTSDAMMKKMLCGSSGTAKGGKFGNDKKGGDLKKMLNMMCMYNAVGDFYCYDKIKTEVAGTKFDAGKTEDKFPNPCDVDCTSTMGTAITSLGCCFPAFMDMQKKYKALKKGQVRTAKALAAKCASSTAFSLCANGTVTPAKNKQFKITANTNCDALASEAAEEALVASFDDQLNLTGATDLLSCKKAGTVCSGSGGRRLSSSSELDLNIETSGMDADTQMAMLTTVMNNPTFVASVASTAVDVSAEDQATTTTQQSAQVSSARDRRVTGASMLALSLGAARLVQWAC